MADRYEDRRSVSVDEAAEAARAPSPSLAGAKPADPLAELAKLIGQTDPFANFGRANPTHPLRRDAPNRVVDSEQSDRRDTDEYFDREIFDEAPRQPAWIQHRNEALMASEPDEGDLSTRPHPLHRFANQHEGEPAEGDAQYSDGQYPDPHYGQGAPFQNQGYQNDPYAYADDYADRPDAAREKSRRGLLTVAAVLGLAVVGTGGAFAYRTYVSAPRSSAEVPVIKADPTPIKVVPPTTADAANKLIQDRLGTTGTEAIVPREEQPVDVRDPSKAGAKPPANFAARAPSAGTVPVPNSPAALPGGEEPKRIRTLTVKGDQNDTAGYAPKPATRPAAQTPTSSAPAPAARAPSTPGPTAALAPSNAPMSINPRAPAPAPATSGGYVVQVSSQRSESDAQASYRALQAKFPSVLGSRSANIKRADLGEKGTYYRAVLGPFSSPEDAAALCGNLKSAGGQCVVQRN